MGEMSLRWAGAWAIICCWLCAACSAQDGMGEVLPTGLLYEETGGSSLGMMDLTNIGTKAFADGLVNLIGLPSEHADENDLDHAAELQPNVNETSTAQKVDDD